MILYSNWFELQVATQGCFFGFFCAVCMDMYGKSMEISRGLYIDFLYSYNCQTNCQNKHLSQLSTQDMWFDFKGLIFMGLLQ